MERFEFVAGIPDVFVKEKVEELLKEISTKYIWGGSYGHFLFFTDKEIEEYRNFLEENGLQIEQIHCIFGGDYDFSIPDENKRAVIVESTKSALIKLGKVKVKNFVIHCSGIINENEKKERIKIFIDSLSRILPVAEKTGIKIAIENVSSSQNVIGTAEEIMEILEKFNSPCLGVCFDTGHANLTGRFKEEFLILKDKIFTFHIHDNDGKRDLHLPPVMGTIDWKWFVKELKKSNYSGQLPLEIVIPECSSWKEVISNMEKLFENDGEGEFSYCNRIIKMV